MELKKKKHKHACIKNNLTLKITVFKKQVIGKDSVHLQVQ